MWKPEYKYPVIIAIILFGYFSYSVFVIDKSSKNLEVYQVSPYPLNISVAQNPSLLHQYLLQFSKDNTVQIISINAAYVPMALNYLCSYTRVSPKQKNNIVFWAMDVKAFKKLTSQFLYIQRLTNSSYPPFGVFHDHILSSDVPSSYESGSKKYTKMMLLRPTMYLTLLRDVKLDLLLVDADVILYDNLWERMFDPELVANADFIMSTGAPGYFDGKTSARRIPPINPGLMWIKSRPLTVKAYEEMVNWLSVHGSEKVQDQMAMNHYFLDSVDVELVGKTPLGWHYDAQVVNEDAVVKVAILDQTQYSNAGIFKNSKQEYLKRVKQLRQEEKKGIVSVHCSWWYTDKYADFKKLGFWIIEDQHYMCIADKTLPDFASE